MKILCTCHRAAKSAANEFPKVSHRNIAKHPLIGDRLYSISRICDEALLYSTIHLDLKSETQKYDEKIKLNAMNRMKNVTFILNGIYIKAHTHYPCVFWVRKSFLWLSLRLQAKNCAASGLSTANTIWYSNALPYVVVCFEISNFTIMRVLKCC